MSQSIIDDTLEILRRFKAQAKAGNLISPALENILPTNDDRIIELDSREEEMRKVRAQFDRLETMLKNSYRPDQTNLEQEIEAHMESPLAYPTEAIENLERALQDSLDETQKKIAADINESRRQLHGPQSAWLSLLGNNYLPSISIYMPPDKSNREMFAASRIIAYSDIALHDSPDTAGTAIPRKFHPHYIGADCMMQLYLYGDSKEAEKDLTQVEHYIDKKLRKEFANPDHWKRVKIERGVAYRIRGPIVNPDNPAPKEILFDAVDILARSYYKKDARLRHYLNGKLLNDYQFIAQLKASQEEIPSGPEPERQIFLSGQAAKDIIGDYLGVDMARIKDAPRHLSQ